MAKKRQKRGFKDQWPFKISIYRDERGVPKGDAALTYETSDAALAAPNFFNGNELKGKKIKVEMAHKSEKKPGPPGGGPGGPGGGFGPMRGGPRGRGRSRGRPY